MDDRALRVIDTKIAFLMADGSSEGVKLRVVGRLNSPTLVLS